MAACSEPDCAGRAITRGMCNKHYKRVWKEEKHRPPAQHHNTADPEIPPGVKLALRVTNMRLALEQIVYLAAAPGDPGKRLRLICALAHDATAR